MQEDSFGGCSPKNIFGPTDSYQGLWIDKTHMLRVPSRRGNVLHGVRATGQEEIFVH